MDGPAFLATVAAYQAEGWRLAVVNATAVLPTEEFPDGAFDISWSFARDGELEHLRERVVATDEVPSISGSFGSAFLYENELRELFGINVTGMAVDLGGQLYKTATRVPFAPSAIRARLEANGKAARGAGTARAAAARAAAGGPDAASAGAARAGAAGPAADGEARPDARRSRS